MAWTKTTRKEYRRVGQRYASDMTAKEWMLLSQLLPKRSRTGRPNKWHLRTIMDAILYRAPRKIATCAKLCESELWQQDSRVAIRIFLMRTDGLRRLPRRAIRWK